MFTEIIRLLAGLLLSASAQAPATLVETPLPAQLPASIISLPDGLTQVEVLDGCVSAHICPYGGPANYYYAPSRTIVLYPDQSARTQMHERCHAHQHETILSELGREPTLDLREWYQTGEGRAWTLATGGQVAGWRLSAPTPIEDFAEACGTYFADPETLRASEPLRFELMARLFGN